MCIESLYFNLTRKRYYSQKKFILHLVGLNSGLHLGQYREDM